MAAGHASGSCLCRAVRFTLRLPTKWCAHCHCTMCRRAHGAAFVTWVGVPLEQFTMDAGAEHVRQYDSSANAWRRFCDRCGSTLFFGGDRWPDEIHVVLANIDEPIDRPPAAHCYFDHTVEWVAAADDLPRLGGPTGTEPLD